MREKGEAKRALVEEIGVGEAVPEENANGSIRTSQFKMSRTSRRRSS